ncbi:MAG: hypothetical protein PHV37_02310 [Candidatus Gastranaerophilales bacterium]|nr:hypothetical protein [Candidatus Gastranaerophilales bacterium]
MRVSPIRFQINNLEKKGNARDFIPSTVRYNQLHDMEFDIIAERIRAENLKNQMNLKLAQLKQSISKFINGNNGKA